MSLHDTQIRKIALQIFQYQTLLPGQQEAIEAILNGDDTLAVMPTGSGNSAIYQIPAMMLDGPTVVISPLIALQHDQSATLNEKSAGNAAVINSLLPVKAQDEAMQNALNGSTEFLFMTPEQLSKPERLAELKASRPSLFVVDEAHCISEWGHSFRPDYLHLGKAIEALGHPRVLALTATANEEVRREITVRLGMRNPKVFVKGFDRPNLWLGVETASSPSKKHALLLDKIRASERPGIVYVTTRSHAVAINDELNNVGISSVFYHGGLSRKARESIQNTFMADQVEVIVATSAFGMGIDKPHVRFVYHYEPPGSIDSYYQEIGRAGRDASPALIILFYQPGDLNIHKFFKGGGKIHTADVESVLNVLDRTHQMEVNEVRKRTGLSKAKLSRVLNRLAEDGALEILSKNEVRLQTAPDSAQAVADRASQAQAKMYESELQRIEELQQYIEHLGCRRSLLLHHFGEEAVDACGNCDNCMGTGTERARVIAETRVLVERENAAS